MNRNEIGATRPSQCNNRPQHKYILPNSLTEIISTYSDTIQDTVSGKSFTLVYKGEGVRPCKKKASWPSINFY